MTSLWWHLVSDGTFPGETFEQMKARKLVLEFQTDDTVEYRDMTVHFNFEKRAAWLGFDYIKNASAEVFLDQLEWLLKYHKVGTPIIVTTEEHSSYDWNQ